MRLTLLVIPAFALGACTAVPQQTVSTTASPEPIAAFEVPMDPGLIRCSSLTNPNALAAATQWTIGQARAGVLAGRVAELPNEGNLAQTFTAYCAENPNNTVRAAAVHWGLAS
ncbi:hypothetical protein SAMN05444287_0797 [Octadecabacter temperatus]|uniref:Uncharacterized protein n=1 Tax=Octadecabacter temperatus TaxID=1458307 RepID=A0A0K0Y426_9RHOB|nr:hypothetical protein [Octadecabacter temperatus]AKS45699.1 hypothetical protein OSB_11430 [Octadecabacter temperatus]SIN98609.1 hypothetical protein SAMN05444287_0797 [Octadecabacter temperatus]